MVLKGLNRRSFEDKLVRHVRRRMKPCGSFQIYIRQSTIYVAVSYTHLDVYKRQVLFVAKGADIMPKRRANGEGKIRKRKDGRWEGRYTVCLLYTSCFGEK